MNSIEVGNKKVNTEYYVLIKTCGFSGEQKVTGIFKTEEDLAYYAFFSGLYRMNVLSSVCAYNDLITPNNDKLTDKGLNQLIQHYFPEETKKIDKRMDLCSKKWFNIVYNSIGNKFLNHWTEVSSTIVKNMPQNKKSKYQEVMEFSENEINQKFSNIVKFKRKI